MSAGAVAAVVAGPPPRPDRDLLKLAPLFRIAVEKSIIQCRDAGLDAFVYEAYRSLELQQVYYARGRTVKPPHHTVTNAPTNLYSWHGYGLAVDVISEKELWWDPNAKISLRLPRRSDPNYDKIVAARVSYAARGARWFRDVANIFKANGCKWGGDWKNADLPHMQWGRCRASPSDRAREILARDGLEAVWREVLAA